ncbi:MAG: hypothetical protein BGO01_00545 [Armatimonadetes bacterium 55-13]|nr:hypothetical protein [Armatimonadota bacterium]ODU53594.1 MAG: hypothetical protein ABT09_01610 [bacterium SCN 57-13]OJU62088.1 MAG: hypothetical protein BGO01_00545 [Armatimonadetes bacterium 55-13]
MKILGSLGLLAVLALASIGCGSPGGEEKQAYDQLQVKPQTEQDKKMIESITGNKPTNMEHAGIPSKP